MMTLAYKTRWACQIRTVVDIVIMTLCSSFHRSSFSCSLNVMDTRSNILFTWFCGALWGQSNHLTKLINILFLNNVIFSVSLNSVRAVDLSRGTELLPPYKVISSLCWLIVSTTEATWHHSTAWCADTSWHRSIWVYHIILPSCLTVLCPDWPTQVLVLSLSDLSSVSHLVVAASNLNGKQVRTLTAAKCCEFWQYVCGA